jgi:general secretion pathway protein G
MNGYVERLRRDERGFTLIELLIVIVILGILAGIVLFSVGGVTDRGSVAACKSDLKTIETAVEAYRAKNGTYPTNLVALTTGTNQFLRPAANLGTNPETGVAAPNVLFGDGYVVEYQGAATAAVWVGEDPDSTAADVTCEDVAG